MTLRSPHFLAFSQQLRKPSIWQSSRGFARIIAIGNQIKVVEPLFDIAQCRAMQHRRECYSIDPAVTWLCSTISSLFRK